LNIDDVMLLTDLAFDFHSNYFPSLERASTCCMCDVSLTRCSTEYRLMLAGLRMHLSFLVLLAMFALAQGVAAILVLFLHNSCFDYFIDLISSQSSR
jgi:hypothetical protein